MYTDSFFGMSALKKEHEFRLKHGFKSILYNKDNNPFPFKIKLGLFNEDGGTEINPYLFTKQMIENAKNQNNIFENTQIIKFETIENELIATTKFGNKIKTKKSCLQQDLILPL